MAADDSKSPMMRQYDRIKAAHPDAILFFRLGDFYEMFYEDAELASSILDITLTARNRGTPSEAPMCGVPHHSADGYLARLLSAGHKVAIAEQVEDASEAKGTVRREVVRVMSPGTLVEEDLLESRANNYLVAVLERRAEVGVAALDVSTGEFVAAQFDEADGDPRERAREEVSRWAPREVCHPEDQDPRDWVRPEDPGAAPGSSVKTWSPLPPWVFDPGRAEERLCEHFGVAGLDGFDLGGQELAVGAAGALLHYVVEESHKAPAHQVKTIHRYRDREVLQLDASSRRSLELVESWQGGTRKGSLLDVIDRSVTAMGGRRMRQWLLRPLRRPEAVRRRQELVALLFEGVRARDALRAELKAVHDLERLTTRVVIGRANPRDLLSLRTSLETVPAVREALQELGDDDLGADLLEDLDPCRDLVELVASRLQEDPPATVGGGDVIREGADEELDRLRNARREGKGFIAGLEAQEREATGIGSLKVGFNKVFGYYIEVSKANLDKVPDDYIRKQTLTNAERYITPELKEFEETVLGAEEKIEALEQRLFSELRDEVAGHAARLRRVADAVATLDGLASLAEVAAREGWCRPRVDDGTVLEIRAGRHPVVEALQPDVRFVPNDTFLDGDHHRIKLVTGPNMGGKSTYLRQTALIAILAQMGGFVPAEGARIGAVDRIFTRVGASDNLARGASTFLVEMQEAANILHHATRRSLILLDEVGRGTSTWDGLAIAWAVVEYLHDHTRSSARTLFATHYHELTVLEERLDGLTNLHVTVHEGDDGVVFLHRVEPGTADRSYGIHVGRLAGLPAEVIGRAEEVLADLEREGAATVSAPAPKAAPPAGAEERPAGDRSQLSLFGADHPVLERIRRLQLDRTTPLEALNLLAAWRQELDAGEDPEG